MPIPTHYYDAGKPLCGLPDTSWNWSLYASAVSCEECRARLDSRDTGRQPLQADVTARRGPLPGAASS